MTKKPSWKKQGAVIALLSILRTWMPSILLHAGILLCLAFVSVGVGLIGESGEDEHAVNIVMRQAQEQQELTYLDQQQFHQQNQSPHNVVQPQQTDESIELSDLQAPRAQAEADVLIGLNASDAGGGQLSGGSNAGGGQVSFFGLEGKGKRLVYIVDKSGSMQGKLLAAAKAELKRSIDSLPRGSRYAVYFFSGNTVRYAKSMDKRHDLVRATRRRNKDVFNWVDGIVAMGSTEPLTALMGALSLEPDVIYFLTDGEFDPLIIEKVTESNKSSKIQIHCIGFGNSGRVLLRDLSKRNYGQFRFVSMKDYKP